MSHDFYSRVPKDFENNLKYRRRIRERCAADEVFQQACMAACKVDVLYWLNTFAWIYEPRPRRNAAGVKLPTQIPFITWPHQDAAILQIMPALGYEDIGVEKSRGEGMSWIFVLLALRDWLFEPMAAIGLVSKSEDSVDSADDSDSLMWKLDWELKKLPSWMIPGEKERKRNLTDHTLKNALNGSMITGYAATGDVASGGRKRWFLMDELSKFPKGQDEAAMASTQHVTDCRAIVSTPKGSAGEYHRIMHEPSSMLKLVVDWRDNPTRNRGLYEIKDGQPIAIDPINNPLTSGYYPPTPIVKDLWSRLRRKGFKLEGRPRSAWYDHECDRAGATPQSIAQELDRDYGGSMFRIFGHDFFAAADKSIQQPLFRGALTYDSETIVADFEKTDDGPILVWAPFDIKGKPAFGQYIVSADISSGLGGAYTSNSVCEVMNLTTGEQVLEYSTNTVEPQEFADMCVAIAKLFWNAYLAWEANGPGQAFSNRVRKLQYDNIFYRKDMQARGNKKTKKAGWWTDDTTKEMMFSELLRQVKAGEYVLRSELLIKECGQYVRQAGKIEHVSVAGADDSVKGKAHGDRVIAACVGVMAARDRPTASAAKSNVRDFSEPPPYSMAARQVEYDRSLQAKDEDEWDSRENSDLARPTMRRPFGDALETY